MDMEWLRRDLNLKTREVFEKRGSAAIQAFDDAKRACAAAGISDDEIKEIVYAATVRRGRG